MKSAASLLAVVLLLTFGSRAPLRATTIAGTGGTYDPAFGSDASVTYVPPSGGLLTINLDTTGTASTSTGAWNLTAQGGAAITLLGLGLDESGSRVSVSSNTLHFSADNSPDSSLLGALNTGTSLHYGWTAKSNFSSFNYAANSEYTLSFHVDGNSGLLQSVLGVTPTFNVQFVDGSGNPLAVQGGGTVIDLIGLLGPTPVTGDVTLKLDTGSVAPTGPVSVKFGGSANIGASTVGIGTNFATVSNVNLSVDPVPEPGSAILIMVCGVCVMFRRRRLIVRTAPAV